MWWRTADAMVDGRSRLRALGAVGAVTSSFLLLRVFPPKNVPFSSMAASLKIQITRNLHSKYPFRRVCVNGKIYRSSFSPSKSGLWRQTDVILKRRTWLVCTSLLVGVRSFSIRIDHPSMRDRDAPPPPANIMIPPPPPPSKQLRMCSLHSRES